MSCEQAALAGLDWSPCKSCATKAREQVAPSCRISPQSSSLQQKLCHPTLLYMLCTDLPNLFTRKICNGRKVGLILGNKWKPCFRVQMATRVCVTAARYFFQGHLKQRKLFPFLCNKSLFIYLCVYLFNI